MMKNQPKISKNQLLLRFGVIGDIIPKHNGRFSVILEPSHPYRPIARSDDRNVPAGNNLAERELRPLVIARKISFGSQSEKGARTREILMTVLHTLKKRTPDAMAAFKSALDKLAEQPNANPAKLLFGLDSS